MTTLPEGAVTFLMTDVEGSTRLWEQHAPLMPGVIARHDELVAAAVAGSGGLLLRDRSEGDSSFAVFVEPRRAITAAIDLQRRLAAEPWVGGLTIRARAAIHSGDATPRAGSYYGPLVNRVVRLRAVGHGGQTLASGPTVLSLGESPPPEGATFRDLGLHRLKDLARPERVFEVVHPDLADGHPPLRSLDVVRHNLPASAGALIGRAAELPRLVGLVRAERSVALLGPGGVGKTRLALAIAAQLVEDFAAGTWFVDLSRLPPGASDLTGALASVVGVREQPGRPLIDTIADAFGDGRVLLLLDNCEHVLEGVRAVTPTLLRRCPQLHVLATSRERIGLAGERIARIGPLRSDHAVELFTARSGVAPSPATEEVCRRLEGIPLAVEMAAAQAAARGLDAVVTGLGNRLVDLGEGEGTLRATIDWSHRLLGPDEQVLFRRLGVFLGPFDLDAVEGICPDGSQLDRNEVLDLLGDLVDASLLLLGEGGGYRLLAPVRDYAADALAGSGELDEVRRRHLAWYRDLVEGLERELESPAPTAALDRLELEHDNLIGALAWRGAAADRDAQMALASALYRFWDLTGRWAEGRAQLQAALDRGSTYRTFRSTAHFRAGALAERQTDLVAAEQHQRESFDILDDLARELEVTGDERVATIEMHREVARARLAELARLRGERERAAALARETVDRLEALGRDDLLPVPLQCLALVAVEEGRPDDATALLIEALDLVRAHGTGSMERQLLNDLGAVARATGNLADAARWYRESLDVCLAIRDRYGVAQVRFNLAELALQQRPVPAQEVQEVRALFEELADVRGIAESDLLLGDAAALADPDAALAHYRSARAARIALDLAGPVLEADLRLAGMRPPQDPRPLLGRAEDLGDRVLILEALVTAARAAPGDPDVAEWLVRAGYLAASMRADLEVARVVETAVLIAGDRDLLAEVDRWRMHLGAVTSPRDERWRTMAVAPNASARGPAAEALERLRRRM